MARLNVNPTRMELKKLQSRLNTAVRGHKLLKDKSDEMIRRFSVMLRENKRLRDEVEEELSLVLRQFSIARSVTPEYRAEAAFALPTVSVTADCTTASVMGVEVPKVQLSTEQTGVGLPYAFTEITSEADNSVEMVSAERQRHMLLGRRKKPGMWM